MSNKTQLQTNNTALDALITRVNAAKDIAASLPSAGGGSGGGVEYEVVEIPSGAVAVTYTLSRVTAAIGSLFDGISFLDDSDYNGEVVSIWNSTPISYKYESSMGGARISRKLVSTAGWVYYENGQITLSPEVRWPSDNMLLILINDPSKPAIST